MAKVAAAAAVDCEISSGSCRERRSRDQFESPLRANGSDSFIQWGDNTLELAQTPQVLWLMDDEFDFGIAGNAASSSGSSAGGHRGSTADQVGCANAAQEFEFDYVGVIVGPDLVYQPMDGHRPSLRVGDEAQPQSLHAT